MIVLKIAKIFRNYPIKIKEIEKNIDQIIHLKLLVLFLIIIKILNFFGCGADNLINFHNWQKWKKIFNDMSIVIFKRHGYNNKALKSIAC